MKKQIVALMLLVFATVTALTAGPVEQGKFTVNAPLFGLHGLLWAGEGFSGNSFSENGTTSLFFTQSSMRFGFFVIDGLEAGVSFSYRSWKEPGLDAAVSFGLHAAYYLDLDGLLPFAGVQFRLLNASGSSWAPGHAAYLEAWEMQDPKQPVLGFSLGTAYMLGSKLAPYISLDLDIYTGVGTLFSVGLGLKGFF